ncbi:helix-turn-helix domain-containing protein [Paenilisteria rocourtiae]|uniref:Helix-turn-helix protein n=1 Tax=Listeria rocourtiae TaxID=647910 RepID=A0A4R6ZRF6_9LIST|nr:helix-turn-helix transcriptional regulator [Listeria rocourtiae]EUJ44421.1 putative transcriptional regulator [Listeria rocourtiae FSL F6-920]TDR55098.1 helix-turn-helix protein [Listeria rocourtiae]
MKTVGETIREIRMNKNIAQSKMKSVSQSSLSAIEKGRLPSIEMFLDILKELDIEMLEFFYVQNGFQLPERDRLFKQFRDQKQSLNENYLFELIDIYDSYLAKNTDPFIEALRHILGISVEVNQKQSFDVESPESKEIWERISLQDVWYHNDIYLMTKIFYTFPVEQAENVLNKAIEQLEKYDNYPQIHFFKIAFLINCSRHYILAGAYQESKKHLVEAEKLARLHQVELFRITTHYLLAYAEYDSGFKDDAIARVERTINILSAMEELNKFTETDKNALNYDVLAKDFQRDWQNFLAEQAENGTKMQINP